MVTYVSLSIITGMVLLGCVITLYQTQSLWTADLCVMNHVSGVPSFKEHSTYTARKANHPLIIFAPSIGVVIVIGNFAKLKVYWVGGRPDNISTHVDKLPHISSTQLNSPYLITFYHCLEGSGVLWHKRHNIWCKQP